MKLHSENSREPSTNGQAQTVISGAALLDCWSAHDWRDTVGLDELSAFDRIIATTRNHTYEIVMTSTAGGTVLVRGGTAFPEFVTARLIGSSLGGGTLRLRTVAVGFRIELAIQNRWLITTAVEKLAVVPAGTSHRDTVFS